MIIVAPEERRRAVFKEIRRPVFMSLPTPLPEACRYISFDRLEQEIEELGDRTQHLQASFLDVLAEEASRR